MAPWHGSARMAAQVRFNVPLSELSERMLEELHRRWPYASKAAIAGMALHRGIQGLHDMPSVASGAPMVEWRRAG